MSLICSINCAQHYSVIIIDRNGHEYLILGKYTEMLGHITIVYTHINSMTCLSVLTVTYS